MVPDCEQCCHRQVTAKPVVEPEKLNTDVTSGVGCFHNGLEDREMERIFINGEVVSVLSSCTEAVPEHCYRKAMAVSMAIVCNKERIPAWLNECSPAKKMPRFKHSEQEMLAPGHITENACKAEKVLSNPDPANHEILPHRIKAALVCHNHNFKSPCQVMCTCAHQMKLAGTLSSNVDGNDNYTVSDPVQNHEHCVGKSCKLASRASKCHKESEDEHFVDHNLEAELRRQKSAQWMVHKSVLACNVRKNDHGTTHMHVTEVNTSSSECIAEAVESAELMKKKDETRALIFQFDLVVAVTKKQLEVRGISHMALIKVLKGHGMNNFAIEFKDCTNLPGAFAILVRKCYITFLQYDLLEVILQNFGDDVCYKRLRAYESSLKCFLQTRLVKLPDDTFHRNNAVDQNHTSKGACSGWETIAIKIEQEWKERCLKDIFHVSKRVASILKINNSFIHIHSVTEGCIRVEWLVPSFIVEQLKRNNRGGLTHVQKKALAKHHITKIICGNHELYNIDTNSSMTKARSNVSFFCTSTSLVSPFHDLKSYFSLHCCETRLSDKMNLST